MAKKGMKRPDPEENISTESNKRMNIPKNDEKPVPEIEGKAKHGNKKAGRMKLIQKTAVTTAVFYF